MRLKKDENDKIWKKLVEHLVGTTDEATGDEVYYSMVYAGMSLDRPRIMRTHIKRHVEGIIDDEWRVLNNSRDKNDSKPTSHDLTLHLDGHRYYPHGRFAARLTDELSQDICRVNGSTSTQVLLDWIALNDFDLNEMYFIACSYDENTWRTKSVNVFNLKEEITKLLTQASFA